MARINLRETLQRDVELEHVHGIGAGCPLGLVERDRNIATASFRGVFLLRVIDEDLTHGASGYREKMRPVLDGVALNLNEAQKRLVDEGRSLEGVVRAFVRKVALGETPKLLVHERYQLVEGAPVPIAPPLKEPRHIARRRPRHPRIIFPLVSQSSSELRLLERANAGRGG